MTSRWPTRPASYRSLRSSRPAWSSGSPTPRGILLASRRVKNILDPAAASSSQPGHRQASSSGPAPRARSSWRATRQPFGIIGDVGAGLTLPPDPPGERYVHVDTAGARTVGQQRQPRRGPGEVPDGIKALAGHVHKDGLKLAIYEDAGTSACAATWAASGTRSRMLICSPAGRTPIEIVSKRGAAVLISLADYQALEETAHLLRSPANARRLWRATRRHAVARSRSTTLIGSEAARL